MKTIVAGGRAWHYSHSIGRQTAEHNESKYGITGGFCSPMDLAISSEGIIFVLSRGFGYEIEGYFGDVGNRIGKTTIDENHFGDFARNGTTWPNSIAISSDGNIFCSDEYENTIYVFSPEEIYPFPEANEKGESILKWGISGSKLGEINGPTGLVFNKENDLYVVDSKNNRIQLFSDTGEFIKTWGNEGNSYGEFSNPWGIYIDCEDNIYVADWGNDRVQKFNSEGNHLLTFGEGDDPAGKLSRPAHVAVDNDGDVYITDWGNQRVQIFESNGQILTSLYGDATDYTKAGLYVLNRDSDTMKSVNQNSNKKFFEKFGRTTGISINKANQIVIADTRCRLQIYQKDNEYSEPSA